ncbi:hypothetical protein A9Q84_16390 [Halobacteriovorax marinus]|uniref:Outer membrane protein n=1 Tax=Halobacteriovorax marinus TaxID=97084 RepID=A0A1Y5FAS9_9BACT|nr:hypothetical protein A9Q84_16390 [Halobacteriovorax marinus]
MKILVLIITAFISSSIFAQSPNESGWYFGGGHMVKKNNRIGNAETDGDKNTKKFYPYVYYKSEQTVFEGLFFHYDLMKSRYFGMGPTYQYLGENYTSDLGVEKDSSIWPGAFLRAYIFNVYWYKDVFGESEGTVTDVFSAIPVAVTEEWKLIPRVGVKFYDANYVNYYYGVKAGDSSKLSEYAGGSGSTFYFSLGNDFQISKNFLTKLSFGYEVSSSSIKDSPTVSSSTTPVSRLTLLYRF